MNISYGRPYGECGYCGKWVRLAGFLAGWHLCLSAEERAQKDWLRNQPSQQRLPGPGLGILTMILGGSLSEKR